jgi:hypothetical protein
MPRFPNNLFPSAIPTKILYESHHHACCVFNPSHTPLVY